MRKVGRPAAETRLHGRGREIAVTLQGPFADAATCACSKSVRTAPRRPTHRRFFEARIASSTLFDATCDCALATSGAHLGPLGPGASAETTALGADEGTGIDAAAVATGGCRRSMRNSQPK